MPVLIIKETTDWARVRDFEGDEVWIHVGQLRDADHVIVTREVVLRRKPQSASPARAAIKPGVLAELHSCNERWCEISAGDYTGWIDKPSLWGLNTDTAGL